MHNNIKQNFVPAHKMCSNPNLQSMAFSTRCPWCRAFPSGVDFTNVVWTEIINAFFSHIEMEIKIVLRQQGVAVGTNHKLLKFGTGLADGLINWCEFLTLVPNGADFCLRLCALFGPVPYFAFWPLAAAGGGGGTGAMAPPKILTDKVGKRVMRPNFCFTKRTKTG